MMRARSSNLDAARLDRSTSLATLEPRGPDPAGSYAEPGPVTLMSAVEGPDGRIIIDSVQMGSPAGVRDSSRTAPASPVSSPALAGSQAFSQDAARRHTAGQVDAAQARQQQRPVERPGDVRIEMVGPPQPSQPAAPRTMTWVSPFANATFWADAGSGPNTPRGGLSQPASGAIRGDEAV